MRRWAEITSFFVGAAAALVLLAGWRVPQGRETVGAGVRLSIGRSPVVELSRTGTVLDETQFRPGDTTRTAVVVTNSAARPLRLRPAAQAADDPTLDRLLRVEVRSGGSALFSGRLSELTGNAARPVRLTAGASARITIRVSLPEHVSRDYAGRSTQVSLVFTEAA